MRRVRLYLFAIFMLFSFTLSAAEGCLIGNTIYTKLNGHLDVTIILATVSVRNYDNPNISTLLSACPRATNIQAIPGPLTLSVCTANGFLLPLGTTVSYDRLDPPLQCDLDDYTWVLGASAAAFGLVVIKKRIRP